MLAGGMGPGEIVKWSNAGIDELKEVLAKPIPYDNSEIIEIYLGARKNNVEEDFFTYIGGSALDNLKSWLKHRDDIERRFNSQGKQLPHAIFINNQYKPLTRKAAQFYYTSQIHRLKIKNKVEKGSTATRYSINMNQIRTVFRSRTEKSDAKKAVLEYFMGHISDKLGYNQTHNDREYRISEYLKALSWVDIKKIDIERQSQESDAQKHELEEAREAIAELQLRMKELEQEKYLAEHSLDYTLARMDEAGVPVNPDTGETDLVTQAMRVFARQMSLDPEGAIKNLNERTRALEEAYRKTGDTRMRPRKGLHISRG